MAGKRHRHHARASYPIYTPARENNFRSAEEFAAEVSLLKRRDSLAQLADDQRLRRFRRRKGRLNRRQGLFGFQPEGLAQFLQ